MLNFHIKLNKIQRESLVKNLRKAEAAGDLQEGKRILAILALDEGHDKQTVASLLKVSVESVRGWLIKFLLFGVRGLKSKPSPGRPPKLTKSQKRELAKAIDKGPAAAGFIGNCWRSPMIQHLIYERFGVCYAVAYINQLLKNMGYSYQKARFVSNHLDKKTRKQWLSQTWPEILSLAQRKPAYLLFGDEVSFPQWGTLSYTWARRGQQPTIETSGTLKGYKVFGLIDYFTGRFFHKCQEQRFNSETYVAFLTEVLARTTKHVILIQDNAPYHVSAATRAFFAQNSERLTVFNFPSYSPDFNPIEKLWKKVKKEGIHLHYFPTFQDLKDKVHETLLWFKNAPKEVLSLFGMYQNTKQAA